MNKQYIRFAVFLLGLQLLFQVFAFSQEQITIVVKDESGNPISGAMVVTEDSNPEYTNEKGEFIVLNEKGIQLLIEAEGFESKLLRLADETSVELVKMPFHLRETDDVYVPFGVLKKRKVAGAVTVIDAQDIIRYDEQKSVTGMLNGRVPGMLGSSNIRGFGSPLFVINGIARPAIDINPREIEQITVVRDLSTAMLYGGQAGDGVVMITTRRGSVLKKELSFTAETGINAPILYPAYLSSADYMTLYNEALNNDGLDPKYSQMQIDSTRIGLNPVRFPDEDYYNSTYLKDFSTYRNLFGHVIRGNERGRFALSAGWNSSGGLLKIGEGANEKNDKLSMRTNIDYEVVNNIDFIFDASVIFNINRSPRYNSGDFWDISTTYWPDIFPNLIPSSLMADSAMLGTAKLIDGKYLLGGTSEYQTNLLGDLHLNGNRRSYNRLVEINTGLNFDLSSIAQGLSARTYILFDMYNDFYEDMQNTYAVYRPMYNGDTLTHFNKYGVDTKVHTRTIMDASYYRRFGFNGMLDYHRIFGDHDIQAIGLAYLDEYNEEGVRQPLKRGHLGLRANYMYRNKYIAELTGVYAISGKLLTTDNPYSFSPGIGLGWIVTEEDFLSGNTLVNYLKLRANWALVNTDERLTDYNIGRNYYVSSTSYPYYGGGYSNSSRYLYAGNTGVSWEKISSINAGFEAMLMDYKLSVEGSYFYYKNYDLIMRPENAYPDFFSSVPYLNFGSDQVQGVELGLNHLTRVNDFEIEVGSNFVYSVPKLLTTDELDYPDEYRRRAGKATDAIFGLVALGLFKDQSEIDGHAVQTFGEVQPGDIKYEDQNNDGVIDQNDQKMIGNSRARFHYGLNLRLQYKGLELFALGTGQVGQDSHFSSSYYWIYGERKYSEVVLDRWTPATAATAAYPRLSSTSNANNFRASTFWLEENKWFELHTAQLTYTLKVEDFIGLQEARFFLRGSNLLKISEIRDKTDLNIGTRPQMRTYSLGLNVMF